MGNNITQNTDNVNYSYTHDEVKFDFSTIDDFSKTQIIEYVKSMKLKSLKIDNTTKEKIKRIQLVCTNLIPMCIELYEKLCITIPENKVEYTNTKLINKKKYFIKPEFDMADIMNHISQQISVNNNNYNINFYNVPNPVINFNNNPITIDEFDKAFNDNSYSKDMIGINKKMLSLLPNYYKITIINNFNRMYRGLELINNIAFGKGLYIYKFSKNGPKNDINSFRLIVTIPNIVNHFHRILALRLSNYMITNKYIDTTIQKGCIGGQKCSVFQQIYKLKEIIKDANLKKNKCAIIFLDIKDAFGNLNRNSLFQIMEKYKIDSNLINYLKTFYDNFEYYISLNENYTITFKWNHGLIQGCSLSPILFVTALSYVSSYLEQFKEEHGYQISDNIKILQLVFLDDICLICKDCESLIYVYTKLEEVLKQLGLSFNYNKTAIMLINDNSKLDKTCLENISKVNVYKYLGEYISSDGTNYESYEKFLSELGKKLYIIDKKNVTNDIKLNQFNEWILPIIHRRLTIMYDLKNNQKFAISSLVNKYMKKWGNNEEIKLFSDISSIIRESNDIIIKNMKINENIESSLSLDSLEFVKLKKIDFKYNDIQKDKEIDKILEKL